MEIKNYAVAVKREATDYILISAGSQEDAIRQAQMLLDEGTEMITLGQDGEDRTISGAALSEPEGAQERADLESNNAAVSDLAFADGASV